MTLEDPDRWTRTMTMLGRVIVVGAVVATMILLVLVERLGTTYQDGLIVTEDSAALVADSIGPVQVLSDDLADLAVAVADSLELAQDQVATTQQIVGAVGEASATNLADTAEAAADVSDRLAGLLEQVERLIPGNRQSVAEELRSFADGLEPVADQLREVGVALVDASSDLDETQAALAALAGQLEIVATDIVELGPSFAALEATAVDLQERAAAASDRIGLDLWLIRILIVAGGALFVTIGVISQRFARALAAAEDPPRSDPTAPPAVDR
jgi:methyl-accepting chemotaxis protein